MPRIHRDRYIKRTNEYGTCWFCGAEIKGHRGYGHVWVEELQKVEKHFCSTLCTELFAEAAVKNDFRLKPCHLINDPDTGWKEVD